MLSLRQAVQSEKPDSGGLMVPVEVNISTFSKGTTACPGNFSGDDSQARSAKATSPFSVCVAARHAAYVLVQFSTYGVRTSANARKDGVYVCRAW